MTMMTDILTHHELTAEWVGDDKGRAVLLTQQDGIDEPDSVLLHPAQLRAVCEQFGIIAADGQAAKTIATLTRRLNTLRERIGHVAYYLANHSDNEHADLSYEQIYAGATADMADEFCFDLDDQSGEPLSEFDGAPAPTPLPDRQKGAVPIPGKALGTSTKAPAVPQASLI
jgi:hypothetical protein